MNESIEDATTPEAFIAALRRQAEKCDESCTELQAAWQDKNAGFFWHKAAQALERVANQLEKWAP